MGSRFSNGGTAQHGDCKYSSQRPRPRPLPTPQCSPQFPPPLPLPPPPPLRHRPLPHPFLPNPAAPNLRPGYPSRHHHAPRHPLRLALDPGHLPPLMEYCHVHTEARSQGHPHRVQSSSPPPCCPASPVPRTIRPPPPRSRGPKQ
ncbi:unnamed protein product [Closterium sp. NIES-54]